MCQDDKSGSNKSQNQKNYLHNNEKSYSMFESIVPIFLNFQKGINSK